MKLTALVFTLVFGFVSLSTVGQADKLQQISQALQKKFPELNAEDGQNLNVDVQYVSRTSRATYMYLNQSFNGIRIKNSTINAAFDSKGEMVALTGTPIGFIGSKAESSSPIVSLNDAFLSKAADLGIQGSLSVTKIGEYVFLVEIDAGNYRHQSKAELVYWATPEDEIKLVWEFDIDMPDQSHWYQYMVSAMNGEDVDRFDWQVSCESHPHSIEKCDHIPLRQNATAARTTLDGSSYNIFPFPVESPNHGSRSTVSEPAFSFASPFGWHDINGLPGADYTITRGNNVHAYEDALDNDSPGASPDGGEELIFDYPLNLGNTPETYQQASITNLFYANNVIHDILYVYGFDEVSGNFQETNYSGSGSGSDYVRAEAQDGESFNNANMATPDDGFNPRMQMFLWNSGGNSSSFVINTPMEIAGSYTSTPAADFGAPIPAEGFSGNLVLVIDDESPTINGCSPYVNPDEMEGNIALMYRGGCSFVEKALFAQEAGAIGVLLMNNVVGSNSLPELSGTSDEVEIPSVMVTFETGQILLNALEDDEEVNVTLLNSSNIKDGSFDNGIIVHEYVHGLTNRLTAGPNNSFCLSNEEQMGEGWSDWYALMLTMNLDIENPVFRPMGTFASGEPVNGNGIRPVPYDTSFAVNSYTYANLPNDGLSVPHGVGFVWSTMLWDLTWSLIDTYGYDPDLMTGNAGNNIALQLVTEALKLQPCSPGFVDGRDAILLADQLLYNGVNECLIWRVFGKRGLGINADQGSTDSKNDGTASFEIAPLCQQVFEPPTAGFTSSTTQSCTGFIEFTDQSVDVPQGWLWEFGDGNSSSEQNPTHVYQDEGIYSVSLTVTNLLGEDQQVQSDFIEFIRPTNPNQVSGVSGCEDEMVELSASSTDGNPIRWLDANLEQIGLGEILEVALTSENESYFAQSYFDLPVSDFVGPEDADFGTGTIHGSNFTGTVDFEVAEPLIIESAFVVSGEIGPRTITLYDDISADGEAIESIVVNIDFIGEGRIDLGFEITVPGSYSIGASQAELFRHDSGADYPYDIDGIMTITGSPAGPEYYYYFYDLEVSTLGCVSDLVEVPVEITGEAAFAFGDSDLEVSFIDQSPEASSWLWDFGDGNTSTEQNPTHTYSSIGVYQVTLTVDGGCSLTTAVPVGTTSLDNIGASAGFSLFPNPTSSVVYLDNQSFGSDRLTLRLYDVSGKEVLNRNFTNDRIELDLQGFNSGLYFIMVSKSGENSILFRDKITVVE